MPFIFPSYPFSRTSMSTSHTNTLTLTHTICTRRIQFVSNWESRRWKYARFDVCRLDMCNVHPSLILMQLKRQFEIKLNHIRHTISANSTVRTRVHRERKSNNEKRVSDGVNVLRTFSYGLGESLVSIRRCLRCHPWHSSALFSACMKWAGRREDVCVCLCRWAECRRRALHPITWHLCVASNRKRKTLTPEIFSNLHRESFEKRK